MRRCVRKDGIMKPFAGVCHGVELVRIARIATREAGPQISQGEETLGLKLLSMPEFVQ